MAIQNLGNVQGEPGAPGKSVVKTSVNLEIDCTNDLDSNGNYIIASDPLISGQKYLEITVSYSQQRISVPYFIKNTATMVGLLDFSNYQGASSTLRCALPTPFDYSLFKGSGQQEITAVKLIENGEYWESGQAPGKKNMDV